MTRIVVVALFATCLLAGPSRAAVLIDCYDGGTGTDYVNRGFYVTDYPGSSLTRVQMYFSSHTAGDYTIRLTARSGAYDGEIIGEADATVTLTADTDELWPADFDFADPAATPHAVIAFSMEPLDGPAIPLYGIETDNGDCPIVETQGTTPPLDTWRRDGVRIRILGDEVTPVTMSSWGQVKMVYR
jgi:hypothetical protein